MSVLVSSIAVFGAAFNPPHFGHADAVRQVAGRFDRVILVPSISHAFGKVMASWDDRLAMLHLFRADVLGDVANVVVSEIETTMHEQNPDRPVYSYDLLVELRRLYDVTPTLVLGPDNARPDVWQRFYRYQDIEREFGIVAVAERLGIRSTQIRDLISAEKDLDVLRPRLVALVGNAVADYILQHPFLGLFRG